MDMLTFLIGDHCRSPHNLVLGGIQILDQKVRGHFAFSFHFDLSSLDNFKPFVFQGSI